MTLPPKPARQTTAPARIIRRYSALPFVAALLLISALCALSFVRDSRPGRPVAAPELVARGTVDQSGQSKQDCHLVHHARDKCAFVRSNCPDEEAGLFSYLELYYCRLPNAQPLAFTVIVLWLCLLFSTIGIAASDFFCVNLSTIAGLLGMSESLAGVTFLAFGNGSPDVFSTFAAMGTNSGSLAIGELIGAAGFITAVVAGSMALVRPFWVPKKSFLRDVGFFIVAAGLSLAFLLDGKLTLWESAAMVLFYVFYVVFVFCWHWWFGKRKRQKVAEYLARNQFAGDGSDVEPPEPYHDDEDLPTSRPSHSRTPTADDLVTVERLDADDAEEDRERWLGEINNNMRVSRPRAGERRLTVKAPIRPSLVGALEFRAVLSGLQKARNLQTTPISLRRYSDDPTFTTAQQQDQLSTVSDPPARPAYEVLAEYGAHDQPRSQYLDVKAAVGTRARAVSANDADALRYDPSALHSPAAPKDLLAPLNEGGGPSKPPSTHDGEDAGPSAPSIHVSSSPPPPDAASRPQIVVEPQRSDDANLLAPPGEGAYPPPASLQSDRASLRAVSPQMAPQSQQERSLEVPTLTIPPQQSGGSSPSSPFPPYTDDHTSFTVRSRASSIRLPGPGMSRGSLDLHTHLAGLEEPSKPWRWWPYRVLPAPDVLFGTLFPTLYSWHDKNVWEKFLGVVAAPSVLLLTLTLPVVETDRRVEEDDGHIPTLSLPPSASFASDQRSHPKTPIAILEPDSPAGSAPSHILDPDEGGGDPATALKGFGGHGTTATVAASHENLHVHAQHPEQEERLPLLSSGASRYLDSPEQLPQRPEREARLPLLSAGQARQLVSPEQIPSATSAVGSERGSAAEKDWNRWLLLVQCFTSPAFTACIVYANFLSAEHGPRLLLRMLLWALLASCALLALALASSTPARPPRWRGALCFAGFVVSICWISTVAGEVVGVLKWLGVVLNMSDAILGLTIFAVGNSLGDLVADITVARLGYPVMALSACFGGPMLNILLGIGLSGLYLTARGARDRGRRHPGRPVEFRPFHVDVSGTLWISGLSLLVTLCVLLVAVPARRWRMDRVVGLGLMALWLASTTTSVVLEVLGLADDIG